MDVIILFIHICNRHHYGCIILVNDTFSSWHPGINGKVSAVTLRFLHVIIFININDGVWGTPQTRWINSVPLFKERHCAEITNPTVTNKPTGCRPPNLSHRYTVCLMALYVSTMLSEPSRWLSMMTWCLFGTKASATMPIGACPNVMVYEPLYVRSFPNIKQLLLRHYLITKAAVSFIEHPLRHGTLPYRAVWLVVRRRTHWYRNQRVVFLPPAWS